MMTCTRCGTPLTSRRVSRPYAEVGLSNVMLVNVEVRACGHCRAQEVVLPQVETLHDRIAHAIVLQADILTPSAIRFLRTWLGLSYRELALMIGVRRETAFRWERQDVHYPMMRSADHLLRLLVANRASEPKPPLPIDKARTAPRRKGLTFVAPDWQTSVHRGH